MMRSFRLRIIVWTVGVAGLAIAGFAAASVVALHRIKLAAVDETMAVLSAGLLPPPNHERFWERLAPQWDAAFQRALGAPALLRVYAASGPEPFQFGSWPSDSLAAMLPPAAGEIPEALLELRGIGPPELSPRGVGVGRAMHRGAPGAMFAPGAAPRFLTIEEDGASWRFVVYQMQGYNVALGVDLAPTLADLRQAMRATHFGLPLALALLGAGAWFFAGRAIKPIRKLERAAASVSAKTLGARIAGEGEDREFAGLIATFNEMLARLERSFAQASRFSADAAHELKTPLAILQGNLEMALQKASDDSELQRDLGSLLEETQRLGGIARKLLLLAQADAGKLPLKRERVSLDALAGEVAEDYAAHAPGLRFEIELGGAGEVFCDAGFVGQILQNLFSNAAKYNLPAGGVVVARSGREGAEAWVEVESSGEAIPEDKREAVFGRFARLDPARGRRVEGVGLGLSLSREFARAHGGDLEIVDAPPGRNRFRLRLPTGPETAPQG